MPKKRLGELLVSAGLITEDQLRRALEEQKQWPQVNLGHLLVEMGFVEEKDLIRVLSLQLSIPVVDLDRLDIPGSVLRRVPPEFCAKHHLLPFKWEPQGRFLDVAMTEPLNLDIQDALRVMTQCNIRPHLTTYSELARALLRYHGIPLAGTAQQPISIGPAQAEDDFRQALLASGPMREFGPSTIEAALEGSTVPPVPQPDPQGATEATVDLPGSAMGDLTAIKEQVDTLAQRLDRMATLIGQIQREQRAVDQMAERVRDILPEVKALGELAQRLSGRLDRVEAYQERDERVLRSILSLLVDKNVCTADELSRILNK